MMNSHKLGRAALVGAIAMCFGAAPVYAQSAAGTGASGTGAATGSQGGSNSMQGGSSVSRDGTSSNTLSSRTTGSTGGSVRSGTASDARVSATGAHAHAGAKAGEESSLDAWMNRHATENQGRVSRQAYMDEMARRWDSMDRGNAGLTPAEVSRLTGKVDVDQAGPARTGSGVQAGNMGPGNSKAQ
jgi:hypothetical protein